MDERKALERVTAVAPDIGSSLAAALVGAAVAGPGGIVGGAVLGPLVGTGLKEIADRAMERRRVRAGRALEQAAEHASMSVDQLVEAIVEDDRLLELAYRTLGAAAAAAFESKISALAAALSTAVTGDDAAAYDSDLIVSALQNIGEGHIRLLKAMTDGGDEQLEHDASAITGLAPVPGEPDLARGLLNSLESVGLVERHTTASNPGSMVGLPGVNVREVWSVSHLGLTALRLLESAAVDLAG